MSQRLAAYCASRRQGSADVGPSDAPAGRIDRFCELIGSGRAYEAMDGLFAYLSAQRAALPAAAWKDYIAQVLLRHPICDWVHRDPLTARAYKKPLGDSGDAVLLDMVYFSRFGHGRVDAAGEAIFRYTIDSTSMRALRNRRRRLAALIDETVSRCPHARILALGAGHLREIELSSLAARGFAGEIVAVDGDEECLAVIRYEYAEGGVRVVQASAESIAAHGLDLGRFDLVYAADAFECLEQPTATRLAERMFAMLNPGGRMFIANFTVDIPDAGYLESYMDWPRVYRDRREMLALTQGISKEGGAEIDFSFDGTRNLAYLLIRRGTGEAETTSRHERLRQLRSACRVEWLKRFARQR